MGEPRGALATLVRAARERRGWSPEQLAWWAGLGRPAVARLERGEGPRPAPGELAALAAALGLPLDELAAAADRDVAADGGR
jgi:transcriptional regulator with XRE-family HTH domain